jgi:hypothetical protein
MDAFVERTYRQSLLQDLLCRRLKEWFADASGQ